MTRRLTPDESFRAKVWRDFHQRADVMTLGNASYRLLCGIVHTILDPRNNGELTLGPKTLRQLGLRTRSAHIAAIKELVDTKLLLPTTEGQSGNPTFYALSFLTLKIAPPTGAKLATHGQVKLPTSGQLPRQKLPTDGQQVPTSGQPKIARSKECAGMCARGIGFPSARSELHSNEAAACGAPPDVESTDPAPSPAASNPDASSWPASDAAGARR